MGLYIYMLISLWFSRCKLFVKVYQTAFQQTAKTQQQNANRYSIDIFNLYNSFFREKLIIYEPPDVTIRHMMFFQKGSRTSRWSVEKLKKSLLCPHRCIRQVPEQVCTKTAVAWGLPPFLPSSPLSLSTLPLAWRKYCVSIDISFALFFSWFSSWIPRTTE